MGKHSNDPSKYQRTSVAIPTRLVEQFDKNMAGLGLKSPTDLVNMVIYASEDDLALLAQIAERHRARQESIKRDSYSHRSMLAELKSIPPEELQALIALHKQQQAAGA